MLRWCRAWSIVWILLSMAGNCHSIVHCLTYGMLIIIITGTLALAPMTLKAILPVYCSPHAKPLRTTFRHCPPRLYCRHPHGHSFTMIWSSHVQQLSKVQLSIALHTRSICGSMAPRLAYSAVPSARACTKLDTESYLVAVDNCCSYSMSNSLKDFVGPLQSCCVTIKGVRGTNVITKIGTVSWSFCHDDG